MIHRVRPRAIVAGLVVLGVLVLSLGAAEVALRLFAPIYPVGIQQAYQYDPELGYRLRPGIHLFEMTDHLEEIRVNGLGTVNLQERFDGYGSLIFALGDSYTQGTGLPLDEAYPFQLDLLLNRDPRGVYEKRYAVVNLGLAAFGGEQSLITLRRYASLLGKPSVCLYLGADNDHEDDALFRSGHHHRHIVAGSPYWGRMTAPLQWANRTELGKRMKLAVSQMRRSHILSAAGGRQTNMRRSVAELERSVIEQIAAMCREYGALFVVGWANAPSASYDWLNSWAASHGVAFADWWPAVESVRSAIPMAPLMNPHSGGHLRGWVNRLIAEEFARQVNAARR